MTQPDSKHRWRFNGGIHIADEKALSASGEIQRLPLPAQLTVPLKQHIGAPTEPLVEIGERVLKGQIIARAEGYISAPIHAPSSGTVSAIEERAIPHPSGLRAPCIVIDTDGADEWRERQPVGSAFRDMAPIELRNVLREHGLVGLGGATFPTAVKLQPGPKRPIETLVINGAECEPYITCDQVLMRDRAEEIVAGIAIVQHMVTPQRTLIGIEDNKPDSITAMRAAIVEAELENTEVVVVPTRYPTGGEKQLIRVLTGKKVPSMGLPADVGVLCHNVGTCAAIAAAVYRDEPLVERIVTVTGRGIAQPQNIEAPVGTPISALVAYAGGYTAGVEKLVMGGPMMGFALFDDALPMVKGTNCILATLADELPAPQAELPCIRCGACVEACPAELLPQQLYWYSRAGDFEQAQDYHLFDCIECGCCAYVCPSHIPLVQYYRYAKTEIAAAEREKEKAEQARERHNNRQARIERAEQEKAAKLAAKKAALEAKKKAENEGQPAGGSDAKKDAIQAAIERAKQKKAAASVKPKNTDNLSAAQRAQIEAAEKRRAQAAADEASNDPQRDDTRRSAES